MIARSFSRVRAAHIVSNCHQKMTFALFVCLFFFFFFFFFFF
jgi:hypothetical protein